MYDSSLKDIWLLRSSTGLSRVHITSSHSSNSKHQTPQQNQENYVHFSFATLGHTVVFSMYTRNITGPGYLTQPVESCAWGRRGLSPGYLTRPAESWQKTASPGYLTQPESCARRQKTASPGYLTQPLLSCAKEMAWLVQCTRHSLSYPVHAEDG